LEAPRSRSIEGESGIHKGFGKDDDPRGGCQTEDGRSQSKHNSGTSRHMRGVRRRELELEEQAADMQTRIEALEAGFANLEAEQSQLKVGKDKVNALAEECARKEEQFKTQAQELDEHCTELARARLQRLGLL
jgi:chromosome segregation ATPase